MVCTGDIPPALARDLSVSTLPSHKGSDNHTNASRSGISATQGQKLAVQHFLIHLVIQSLICLPFCSSLLVYMHVFHFGKLERGKYKKSNQKRHGQRKYKLIYWSVHALIVRSVIPLSEALRNILLPLSRESVGTCLSHTDNGGASCAVGDGGWATKTRDVVSGSEHEDLAFGGVGGVICCGIPRTRRGGAMTPRLMGVRLYLFPTVLRDHSHPGRHVPGAFPNSLRVLLTQYLSGI